MKTFLNVYVAISMVMYLLHKCLFAYQKKHGETPALIVWHDTIHNIGHLLRIGLVLLLCYIICKSVSQSSTVPTA